VTQACRNLNSLNAAWFPAAAARRVILVECRGDLGRGANSTQRGGRRCWSITNPDSDAGHRKHIFKKATGDWKITIFVKSLKHFDESQKPQPTNDRMRAAMASNLAANALVRQRKVVPGSEDQVLEQRGDGNENRNPKYALNGLDPASEPEDSE
jgi:hypothetical protein